MQDRKPILDSEAARPWPRLMRCSTAAAYCDEVSTRSFRAKVGLDYPAPITKGRNAKWLRDDLDLALLRLRPQPMATTPGLTLPPDFDAATVL